MEPLPGPHMESFEQLSAFYLYTRHGLEVACSVYPSQKDFILANRDKSLEEVRREAYRKLDKDGRSAPPL